ncbi:methylamine utilization protein [Sphingomonas bacterium]|uniref:methylamine utilization protein n=1 Tax=Sphingomonas bacterium TaxID=1895847 RepID=UPI0020C5BF91|nr:methylamine utilization protein [Sphingomonas bacterium]
MLVPLSRAAVLGLAALVATSGIAAPMAAAAATVTIDVRGPDGRPLADAAVTIETSGHAPIISASMLHGPYVMEQRSIAFQPHVLVVPVGAAVSFPNRDPVRHHVYSFSRAKRFDLKLYGREEQRSVVFDRPGVVALGCNIHDSMSGFIIVSASPYAARTDAAGRATLTDVPPGAARLTIWSTAIARPDNMLAQPIVVAASGTAKTVAIGR